MTGLDEELKKQIMDRLEGWELVEFLQISIETIVDTFEETILDNLEDVLELAGLKGDNDDDNET